MFEKTNNDDTSNDVKLKRYVERRQMTHIETIRRTMSNDVTLKRHVERHQMTSR